MTLVRGVAYMKLGEPAAPVESGGLHIDFHGEKLSGRFALIRSSRVGGGGERLLLVRGRDERVCPLEPGRPAPRGQDRTH